MAYRIEPVPISEVPWGELDAFPDRTVGQTRSWLSFLAESQHAEPVVGRVVDGPDDMGWFAGATVRRGAIRQLGSPLKGWTTAAMGFNLIPEADRTAALAALPRHAFEDLRCLHLEFADRALTDDGDVPPGFAVSHLSGYSLDLLGRSDDDLLGGMRPYGRRDVRRALRNGITVEIVEPGAGSTFAAEFYAQLTEAFGKRGLTPTYPVERVEALVRHLGGTGDLLLLRARTADGSPAATGIFPGRAGGPVEFWGGASHRSLQHLLPNEALMWSALRIWRDRGAVRFDFGGGGDYKAKYGGAPQTTPWVRCSRFRWVESARATALRLRSEVRSARGARRAPAPPK